MRAKYAAVLFDLLTALLDSWSLWNEVAGDTERGLRWRREYLRLTSEAGPYRPYEAVIAKAAQSVSLPLSAAEALISRWSELRSWPEVPEVLGALQRHLPIGVVTNSSERLAREAAQRTGATFSVVVSAERAGWYKPDPRPYKLALIEIGAEADRALFVAGSPFDIAGASRAGMPVFWHNRIGLTSTSADAQPVAIHASLVPLLDEVFG